MMKSRSISLAVVACAALVPALSSAQIKKQPNGAYLMRIKYTKGEVIKLTINTTVSGLPPGSQGADASGKQNIVVQTVTKVVSVTNGNATVIADVAQVKINGHVTGQAATPRSITLDTRGRTIGSNAGPGLATKMPEKPVKVGETWTGSLPVGSGIGNAGTATYKFLGIKNVDGKQVGVLSLAIKTAQIKGGTGTLYLNASDGTMYKAAMNIAAINPQTKAPVNMSITVHRS